MLSATSLIVSSPYYICNQSDLVSMNLAFMFAKQLELVFLLQIDELRKNIQPSGILQCNKKLKEHSVLVVLIGFEIKNLRMVDID